MLCLFEPPLHCYKSVFGALLTPACQRQDILSSLAPAGLFVSHAIKLGPIMMMDFRKT